MEYLAEVIGVVLIIIVGITVSVYHLSFRLAQVCVDAHAVLSFECTLGQTAAVRLLTHGSECVNQFLVSKVFSLYCRLNIPGHTGMLLSRSTMTETQWRVYMATNLLHLLAANSFVKIELWAFAPKHIHARWGEIEQLPADIQNHFFLWLNALECDALILYNDGRWGTPPKTLDLLLVHKLPRGDGRKDPEGRMKSPFEPQFAL
jgi:hypothetical protein